MSKPYSEDDLSKQITSDRTWRIRELSDLKTATRDADTIARKVLLRSMIAIAYAHWEGHVRLCSIKYLQHISLRRIRFSELQEHFLRSYFLPRLAAVGQKGTEERGDLVTAILHSGETRFSRVNEDLINTRSNLNSETLAEICSVCGIDPALFADDTTFIDVILLKRRNAIAHGEDTLVAMSDLDEVIDGTVGLMRRFGDELQNFATLKTYRR